MHENNCVTFVQIAATKRIFVALHLQSDYALR